MLSLFPRIIVPAFLLLPLAAARAADSVAVFNEIHYHPSSSQTTGEWVELRSLMGVDVDLSGWRLAGEINFEFPAGTILRGQGLMVIAANPAHPAMSAVTALGPFTGALANSGGEIRLLNNSGRLMDALNYRDDGDWPVGADGSGSTLTKIRQTSAASEASDWTASPESGGTPGALNFPIAGLPPTVSQPIPFSSQWKYRDTPSAPPSGWQNPAFDDSAWPVASGVVYAGSAQLSGIADGLTGYWPLAETSGSSAPNAVPSAPAATLFGGASWVSDPSRGRVLSFNGSSAYAAAGSIPLMSLTNDFTWAFWAYSREGTSNNVILGNRYSPSGSDFSPREFIKFTTSAFEFHRNATPNNLDYADIPQNTWIHHAMVKSGTSLTYYRNGTASGSATITLGLNNPQPLYFGGDAAGERWNGSLDDIAIWAKALPATTIAGIANATWTPATAPTGGNTTGALGTAVTLGANTFYFRKSFPYPGVPARTALTMQLLVDDAAVVYLNGTELLRQNIPAGTVTYATPASSTVVNAEATALFTVPAGALLQGANLLAVEVHQDSPASPDMVFDARLVATEQPAPPYSPASDVAFSEIAASTASPFQIELINQGSTSVNLSQYSLNGTPLSAAGTLAAGARTVLNLTALGLTTTAGTPLFLTGPNGLTAARSITNRLRGLDSAGTWAYPSAPTFGAPNSFTLTDSVVINEIMYNRSSLQADPAEQWIELYNRSASAVSLNGWSFRTGVTFDFPTGTVIPAGGFLLVAKNAAALALKYPGLPIAGSFSGNLSGSGEEIILADANGNTADQLHYHDGGSWPAPADGAGSSLELRDPRADNASPSAWAASDESAKGSWQSFTLTGIAANNENDPAIYNEFILEMLDNGTVLVDDISVIENPAGTARQLIQNGDFSSGDTSAWRFLGTHRRATIVPDPDAPGNKVLRLETSGSAGHMHNHGETTLKNSGFYIPINSGATYTISFRARWLSGSNQLHTRLYFNRLAKTWNLAIPAKTGTPGAPNSRLIPNAGPTGDHLIHSPAVPSPSQSTTVKLTLTDPDGVASARLLWSLNGGAFTQSPMAPGPDNSWSAAIPPQTAGSILQFYTEATDSLGAVTACPAAGPDSRALIPVDAGEARPVLPSGCKPQNFRIVMTKADSDLLHLNTNVMSDDRLGATIILNETEIYYGCGVRLKGSERGRVVDVRVGFNVEFPSDHLFLGTHAKVAVDRSGAGDQFSQKEIIVKHALNRAGNIPGLLDDLIHVIAPRSTHTGSAMLLKARFDKEFLENQYENGADGTTWEYELIYYPTSTTGGPEGLKLPNPDNVAGVPVRSLGTDKELYRWHWLIKNNRDRDDYAALIPALSAIGQNAGTAFHTATAATLDVDQWLRAFAIPVLFGVGDNYGTGSQHNMQIYLRPSDGRALYFPWDMDFTASNGTTTSISSNGDLTKLISLPANRRAYYGHLIDIMDRVFNATYMNPWLTHYSCFLPGEDLSSYSSYITDRAAYVRSQINAAVPPLDFAISTPNGTSTPGTSITLTGKGWVNVREISLIGGAPLPITWTDTNTWQVTVPVTPGAQNFTLQARDLQGTLISSATVSITGTGTTVPASAVNFVISEIMYHPAPPVPGSAFPDPEDYEFLELLNTSSSLTLDLSGVRMVNGVPFNFTGSAITSLPPAGRVLLVRNAAAFTARYGPGLPVAGAYGAGSSNVLSNSGETLTLLDAGGLPIASFAYSDSRPWPISADGDGYSLVLSGAQKHPDTTQPIRWRTSRLPGGTPGTEESLTPAAWLTQHGLTDLTADNDLDGAPNLLEFLAGTDPLNGTSRPASALEITNSEARLLLPVLTIAEGLDLTAETSTTLGLWSSSPADIHYDGQINNNDGQTSTLRFTAPLLPAKQFLRLRATLPTPP